MFIYPDALLANFSIDISDTKNSRWQDSSFIHIRLLVQKLTKCNFATELK